MPCRSAATDENGHNSIRIMVPMTVHATMRRSKDRPSNLAKWCRVVVQETRVRLRVR
jgi:hypothetical protein